MFWFPSLRAWVCALISLLLLSPFVVLLRMASELLYNLLELQTFETDWRLWLFLGVVGFLLPAFFWGHVHQFLWGEPNPKFPRWLPSLSSLAEGAFSWFVSLTVIAFIALLVIAYVQENCPSAQLCQYRDHRTFAGAMPVVFIVANAYLYHWKFRFQHWWNSPARRKWFAWPAKK